MKTDVRELDGSYELDVDLPGFKKDEVTVDLQDGYLTISAAKGLDKDASDKKGKFLRQERYAGSMSRSFYVGDDVESADISAKFRGTARIMLKDPLWNTGRIFSACLTGKTALCILALL